METTSPLHLASREQLRAYLGQTLAGRRQGWPHLAIRHNTIAQTMPCRFCEKPARSLEGPAIFWDHDGICDSCIREMCPELGIYLMVLRAAMHRAGGDWKKLLKAA